MLMNVNTNVGFSAGGFSTISMETFTLVSLIFINRKDKKFNFNQFHIAFLQQIMKQAFSFSAVLMNVL